MNVFNYALGILLLVIFGLTARDYIEDVYMPLMRTQQGFDYVIQKYPYVIAYVYTLPKELSKPLKNIVDGRELLVYSPAYKEVDRIYDLVQQYAEDNVRRYTAAGVKYIGINRDKGDLQYLEDRYQLDKQQSYLLFFKNGALATTYRIPGDFSYQTLHSFVVSTNLEDFIADELAAQARDAAREEAREERACKNRRRRYYSSYYNNGPVVGVGFGCCGYGYPYYSSGCWGVPCGYGCWGGPYFAPGFGVTVAI